MPLERSRTWEINFEEDDGQTRD